jgi:hypothetical protein
MAWNENSKTVFNYLKEHDGENFTAADIAEATGIAKRSVDGIVTASFQRHKNAEGDVEPLAQRVVAEILLDSGLHQDVKFIRLTDAGRDFDPDAAPAE